ncbi:SNF2 family N-terminal domain-containing protein [Xylariaceae sp. FL1272]|nr:SNF2 family N-terminal domain-containing protein [Xylariaceae sp. FL1272]
MPRKQRKELGPNASHNYYVGIVNNIFHTGNVPAPASADPTGSGSSKGSKGRKEAKTYRWNPYNRLGPVDGETFLKFYGGFHYRAENFRDREKFAKFSISKALGPDFESKFAKTGDIMSNQCVTVGSMGGNEVAHAIRTGIQQDIDAETEADRDVDLIQNVSSAAQSIFSASPNCLGPPINPCVQYLRMEKCGEYGRNKSTMWKSPLIPSLDGAEGRRALLDHQVTGIVWLLSRLLGDLPRWSYVHPTTNERTINIETPADQRNREKLRGPKYFGGILADSMGLGKTLITVALVYLMVSQRLNVVQENGKKKYRPILLLTPNMTVTDQWVEEISQVIDQTVIRHIVVSGNKNQTTHKGRVIRMGREGFRKWPANLSYMWEEDDPAAAQCILVVPIDTWQARTMVDDGGKLTSDFTKRGRRFSLVIVDEAYKVKNTRTKNWQSVYHLQRTYTLLITATPCMNMLSDLFGLARLLWTEPENYLKRRNWAEIELAFTKLEDLDKLEELESFHDYRVVAGRPALLAKLLYRSKNNRTADIRQTRRFLKHFESLAMLKRSPSSLIYANWSHKDPVSLEGLYPRVQNFTVEISPGEEYNRIYQSEHTSILTNFLKCLRDWSGKQYRGMTPAQKRETKLPLLSCHRHFQLLSASLDVYEINELMNECGKTTLADDISFLRDNGVHFLWFTPLLLSPHADRPDTHVKSLRLGIARSPILQYILYYIRHNILTRNKNEKIRKLLILEQNLMLAFYYERVLQFLGFECRCMHASLSTEERQELVESFNSDGWGSCQILIQMYSVGFAGTNLHKNCSRVLIASQSYSLQVQSQATHRVIRVGQTADVEVHRVMVKNSYHGFVESRQVEKMLPELGAKATGTTNAVLVQILNLFQHEVVAAWHSEDGQKLRENKNLLHDATQVFIKKEEVDEQEAKRAKIQEEIAIKALELENTKQRLAESLTPEERFAPQDSDSEQEDDPVIVPAAEEDSSSKKRKHDDDTSLGYDGRLGWYNGGIDDNVAFLERYARSEYYKEFVALPQDSKCHLSHDKNNLRRLMSFASDSNGNLCTLPWVTKDLNDAAVLERALELILRVRLGAKEIAMLPFPLIDLSRAPDQRREELHSILAKMQVTDQDADDGPKFSKKLRQDKIPREILKDYDAEKTLAEVDKELEHEAKYGELPWDATTGRGDQAVSSFEGDYAVDGDEDEELEEPEEPEEPEELD